MLLINYDFYDLHSIITCIRNHPDNKNYVHALKIITEYLEKPQINNGLNFNNIRSILTPYTKKLDPELDWILIKNRYTAHIRIIKNEIIYQILIATIREIIVALEENPQRTYLIADASQNIPLLLADERKPKKAILVSIKEYRMKYNNNFLHHEIKRL